MFTKITFRKSMYDILRYNERKLRAEKASILLAGGFARDIHRLSFEEKRLRFQRRTRLNNRSGQPALHITLNFHPKDKLNRIKLQRITLDYFKRIGFGYHPFIAYQHLDVGHPHVHIVSTSIGLDGKRKVVHPKKIAQCLIIRLEQDYGLRPLTTYNPDVHRIVPPEQLEKLVYGQSETKPAICKVVQSIVAAYKFTSLTELNAALRIYNVTADSGRPDSRLHDHKGLYYHAVADNGLSVGKPIKASSIYGKPTRFLLEQLYQRNEQERRPYGVRIRYLLDEALRQSSLNDGMKLLRKHRIQLMFYQNLSGRLQGLAYVDRATQVVFKGDSLGADYSARRILSMLMGARAATAPPAHPEQRKQQMTSQEHQPTLQYLHQVFPEVVLLMTDYGGSEKESVKLGQIQIQKQEKRLYV